MRILVTGGNGTIGRGLVAILRDRGHYVVSVDISHGPQEIGFSLRTDVSEPVYARCDIAEYRQLERVFQTMGPFEYVYHAAAEFGRWNGEDFYETLWRTNATGTKNIIRMQEAFGFRLIHFSSSEVYGDWPDIMVESVMNEYAVKQLNDYAMTKWVNEMQVQNSAKQFGTESVVVRIFNSYGPGEYYSPYRSVNCRFIYSALHGIPWLVYRNYSRTSTYLPDMINTLANIIDNFRPGESYNIASDQYHTIEKLSDIVICVTGANPSLVTYEDAEMMTTRCKKVDVSKAVRDLGHEHTVTLEEGMRLTANWMLSVYDTTETTSYKTNGISSPRYR